MPLSWSQWGQSVLANVAGTQEPIYGPDAFQSVTDHDTPYREIKKEDFKWEGLDSTCVETQTFYFFADSGHMVMCQLIYSNVMGLNTTCQFSSKLFFPGQSSPPLWSTDALSNHSFSNDRYSFTADKCSLTLSEDGTSLHVKSSSSKQAVVDVKLTRVSPGFVAGKDGISTYGTEPDKPWGKMRHAFWPRCTTEGTIITQSHGVLDFKGRGSVIHAIQGMKPHHAAGRWNYMTCITPTYTAVMMEFITPAAYGSSVATVGGIVTDSEIVLAGPQAAVTHISAKKDDETAWPEPTEVKYEWKGDRGTAVVEGQLGPRLDRIDVLAEVPAFIKNLAGGVAGTYPYIYQFAPKLALKSTIDGVEKTEEGTIFTESTFIVPRDEDEMIVVKSAHKRVRCSFVHRSTYRRAREKRKARYASAEADSLVTTQSFDVDTDARGPTSASNPYDGSVDLSFDGQVPNPYDGVCEPPTIEEVYTPLPGQCILLRQPNAVKPGPPPPFVRIAPFVYAAANDLCADAFYGPPALYPVRFPTGSARGSESPPADQNVQLLGEAGYPPARSIKARSAEPQVSGFSEVAGQARSPSQRSRRSVESDDADDAYRLVQSAPARIAVPDPFDVVRSIEVDPELIGRQRPEVTRLTDQSWGSDDDMAAHHARSAAPMPVDLRSQGDDGPHEAHRSSPLPFDPVDLPATIDDTNCPRPLPIRPAPRQRTDPPLAPPLARRIPAPTSPPPVVVAMMDGPLPPEPGLPSPRPGNEPVQVALREQRAQQQRRLWQWRQRWTREDGGVAEASRGGGR